MYKARLFVVRHARGFEWIYTQLERVMVALDPIFSRVGYNRIERPVAFMEKVTKGFLFDCQMCGQCALGSTGMSCPMNCPKQLRNGPCGGVAIDGTCEVNPNMQCVWSEAWKGAARMRNGDGIHIVNPPVDHSLKGSSTWLRVSREIAAVKANKPHEDSGRDVLAKAFPQARRDEPATVPLAKEPEAAINHDQRP